MRISRPCYDKMHRCPGWAGGGMRYAKIDRCDNGHLAGDIYEGFWWRFRVNRCGTCGLYVLPYIVRYGDPRYWSHTARSGARVVSGCVTRARRRERP